MGRTVQDEPKVEPDETLDLFDTIGHNTLPFWEEVKKRIAARPRSVVEELAEPIDERVRALGIPSEQRAEILSQVFMKTAGADFLASGFLTEEELTAPPRVTWKERDKSRGFTIIEHIEEQFADRLNRGFQRADLRTADPTAAAALKNWLSRPENSLPNGWPATDDALSTICKNARDARQMRRQREANLKIKTR